MGCCSCCCCCCSSTVFLFSVSTGRHFWCQYQGFFTCQHHSPSMTVGGKFPVRNCAKTLLFRINAVWRTHTLTHICTHYPNRHWRWGRWGRGWPADCGTGCLSSAGRICGFSTLPRRCGGSLPQYWLQARRRRGHINMSWFCLKTCLMCLRGETERLERENGPVCVERGGGGVGVKE